MKIAVVTPWFPDSDGTGTGHFVLKEAEALRAFGHDVRVVHLDHRAVPGSSKQLWFGHLPTIQVGLNVRNPLHLAEYGPILKELVDFADVIHTHAISSLPAAQLVTKGRPWIHSEHWSVLTTPESIRSWMRPGVSVIAQLERLPDVVVGESERLLDAVKRYRGKGRVELVPCVVPSPQHLTEMPRRGDTLRLMSTGGLIDRKDPLLAVRVLAELRSLNVDASLRWVGDGPLRQGAEELTKELGVDATFLGAQPFEVVESELAACDIFFAPTKGENFFVSAAEALVNGRPICVSSNGGQVEYAPAEFSEIVAEQTPEAYAHGIIKLRDKTADASAEQISGLLREKFAPGTIAASLTSLYEDVAGTNEA
jgi:Glycosyltransferase